jgi:hypothetical protein
VNGMAPDSPRILDEYLEARPSPGVDGAALLETALFLEDAFGIILTDPEIDTEHLGTRDSLVALLRSRGKA